MASASCAHSLLTRPSPSVPKLILVSSSFNSHQHLKSSSAFSLRVSRNRSPLPVLSMRQEQRVLEITSQSWNESILGSETPVLVEFYTNWCEPCKTVHQVIDEIATDYVGKLKCVVINVDEEPQIAEEYDIKAVPVVLMFKNGEKCESVVGTMPREFFVAAIERVLAG